MSRCVIRRSLSTGFSTERQRLISARRSQNLRPGNLKSGLVHRLFSTILFPVRKSAIGAHAEFGGTYTRIYGPFAGWPALHFSIIGTTLSSATHADVKNEVERLTAFAAVEGVERLWSKHIAAWDQLWESDIVIEGDLQSQQDIHSMLYHTYAFVREGSGLSCSPMGLSGFGYNGHVFWDADTWIFPALLLLHPELAESMIEYRYQRLDAARHNAFMHGYKGAMYPWESSDKGNEDNTVTNIYGPFENHITGDVAMAAWQYYAVTQDLEWLRQKGFPILSAAAEYWVSRSEPNEAGEYEIRNVIGADEWNQNPQGGKNVNNNAYTNGVAKSTLEAACKAAQTVECKIRPYVDNCGGETLFPETCQWSNGGA